MASTDKPTARQVRYLRHLAQRSGADYEPPATRGAASEAIARLRAGANPAPEQPKPTRLQMKRLRQLADTTGQTFAYPTTREAAKLEIERMLGVTRLAGFERHEDLAAIGAGGSDYAPEVRDDEIAGFGSSAHWAGAASPPPRQRP